MADEYFAVTDQVGALYAKADHLPADAIGPKMARLRREHHLQAQHDDAAAKGQRHRANLFDQLLTGLTEGEAS